MTQREINLISAISTDSPIWGIISTEWDIDPLHGAVESKIVPPHIYVYRVCEECTMRNEIQPDLTFTDKYGQVIDLYYLTQEGGDE